jgi:hypothetical protein
MKGLGYKMLNGDAMKKTMITLESDQRFCPKQKIKI